DRLADAGDLGGARESSFGVDEPSTVAHILSWIDGLPPDRRFFVAYLPIAGHHPYDTPHGGPFSDADDLGRSRHALHHRDAAIGCSISTGTRRKHATSQPLFQTAQPGTGATSGRGRWFSGRTSIRPVTRGKRL